MKSFLLSILLASALAAISGSNTFAETPAATTAQEVKTKFYELLGKDSTTVNFTLGNSTVSESDRKNLEAVVTAVRADAVISSAIVAAWSDKEYPATKGQKLGESERRLAKARSLAVKEALVGLGVKTVETHTMAERPTWIGKLFNSKDAKVKGDGKVKDANDQLTAEIGKILQDKGGPGKVVVMIRRQGDTSAH